MKKLNIKQAFTTVASVGAGAVGAASLNKIDLVKNLDAPIRGGVKIALGAFGPGILGKGGKSATMIADAGKGAIAVGAVELANALLFKGSPIALSGVDTLGDPYYVPEYLPASNSLGNAGGGGVDTLGGIQH